MTKLTKEQRDDLDADVLSAVRAHDRHATYVYRNWLDRMGYRDIATATVLRACRRLQKARLLEECPSSYAVMLSWHITAAGRQALASQPVQP